MNSVTWLQVLAVLQVVVAALEKWIQSLPSDSEVVGLDRTKSVECDSQD